MNSEISEKLSVVCMSLFALGTATAPSAAPFALGGAGALLSVPALWDQYRSWSDCPEKRAVKKAAATAVNAYRASAKRNHDLPPDAVAPAEAALATVIDLIAFDPAKVTKARWDMAALPDLIIYAAAAAGSEEFRDQSPDPQATHNRALLRFVAEQVLAALRALPNFEASVMPAFRQDVVGHLARIEGKLDRVLTQKDVEAAYAEARTQLKATEGQLQAILELMLKRGVEPDQFARALLEATAKWLSANPRLQSRTGNNLAPDLAALRRDAQAAYDCNEVEPFYEIKAQIVALEEEAYARLQQDQQELENQISVRKDLLIASLEDKQEAAQAALNAQGVASAIARKHELEIADPSNLFDVLCAVQDEWNVRGSDRGLNFELEVSITLARINQDRATNADQRGAVLNKLATTLAILGQRETGITRLEEAVAAYRAALKEWTRDCVPLRWAGAQTNLGNVLKILGERESGSMRLEEAVVAHRSALEEWTRERTPLDWATAQNNLGNALQTLGERESSRKLLEEAVLAYRSALEEWTRERTPLNWAMTLNNLGAVLHTLGKRDSVREQLDAAILVFRLALEERTRERVPLEWARTQNNLGNALATLGQQETGTARLDEAILVFRLALEESTRERVPLEWAMTQNNLGNVLKTLGERESGTARLDEAVVAYGAALQELTRRLMPIQWGVTRNNIALALKILFEKTGKAQYRTDAIKAVQDALEVFHDAGAEFDIKNAERLVAQLERGPLD